VLYAALTLRRAYRLTPSEGALLAPAVFVGIAAGHILVYRPLLFLAAFALS